MRPIEGEKKGFFDFPLGSILRREIPKKSCVLLSERRS